MDYDYDIIVIGGGPAGLSAAVRSRRVRTYNLLSSSVLVLNNGGLGGLSNWKEVYMTGPGWSYKKDGLLSHLMRDLEHYNIEVRFEEAVHCSLQSEVKVVNTKENEYRSLGIVIATGMKKVWNEKNYMGRGLLATLKGYKFMEEQFESLCLKNPKKTITFVGTGEVDKTLAFFESINRGRMEVRVVVEPPVSDAASLPGEVVLGWLEGIYGEEWVEGVEVDCDGDKISLQTDFVLIDFESYMLHTNTSAFLEGLPKTNGFIQTDRSMATEVSGVFAAGDITGPPFSVAKAVGQGVTAGLECYRYVFRLKFGEEPPMYAFYPIHDEKGTPSYFTVPELKDNYRLKLLGRYEVKDGNFVFSELSIPCNEASEAIIALSDGRHEVAEVVSRIAEVNDLGSQRAREVLEDITGKLIVAKEMTIHT